MYNRIHLIPDESSCMEGCPPISFNAVKVNALKLYESKNVNSLINLDNKEVLTTNSENIKGFSISGKARCIQLPG